MANRVFFLQGWVRGADRERSPIAFPIRAASSAEAIDRALHVRGNLRALGGKDIGVDLFLSEAPPAAATAAGSWADATPAVIAAAQRAVHQPAFTVFPETIRWAPALHADALRALASAVTQARPEPMVSPESALIVLSQLVSTWAEAAAKHGLAIPPALAEVQVELGNDPANADPGSVDPVRLQYLAESLRTAADAGALPDTSLNLAWYIDRILEWGWPFMPDDDAAVPQARAELEPILGAVEALAQAAPPAYARHVLLRITHVRQALQGSSSKSIEAAWFGMRAELDVRPEHFERISRQLIDAFGQRLVERERDTPATWNPLEGPPKPLRVTIAMDKLHLLHPESPVELLVDVGDFLNRSVTASVEGSTEDRHHYYETHLPALIQAARDVGAREVLLFPVAVEDRAILERRGFDVPPDDGDLGGARLMLEEDASPPRRPSGD